MPIAFACPECGKKYRVDEKLAGKKAKCQGCGGAMVVPAATGSAVTGSAVTGSAAAEPKSESATSSGAPAAGSKSSDQEKNEFGLSGFKRDDDPFAGMAIPKGGNPLGDDVVEDYGIAAVEVAEEPIDPGVEIPEFGDNPAVEEFKKIQKETAKLKGPDSSKGGKKSKGSVFKSPSFWASIVLFLSCAVAGLVAIFSPVVAAMLAFGILLLAGLIDTVAQFWSLAIAFRLCKDNMVQLLMYLFVPFYILFFWIKNWGEMRGPVVLMIVATIAMMVAVGEYIAFSIMSGM